MTANLSSPSRLHSQPFPSQNSSSITALTPSEETDISLILAELKKWAPILGRLHGDQVAKLAAWLDEKIERLMTWGLMGTDEQRFQILDRLTKLQEGPMNAHTIIDRAIEQQLNGLSCKKLVNEDGLSSDFDTIDSDGEWFHEPGSEV
ncbi:MAG: hypothetical protein Q9195_005909 [Heterodermia aff. obscurata]